MNKCKLKLMPWLICGLAGVFYAYEYFLRISPNVLYGDLLKFFGIQAVGYSLFSTFYMIAYAPMQLPVGILMDRFGPRKLLTLACLLCAIGTFLFASTSYYYMALVGRFLVGFGSAFAFVGVMKLATIWLPADRFAMVSGLASALGSLIGAVIGEIALEYLVHYFQWRPTILFSAVSGILLAAAILFFVKDHDPNKRDVVHTQSMKKVLNGFIVVLKNKFVWLNGCYGFLMYMPASVFADSWLRPYLLGSHGFQKQDSALAVSILYIGFVIGAPIFGLISDIIGKRRLPMIIGAICTAIIFCLILYIPDLSVHSMFCLLFLLGVAFSAEAIVFAVGRELAPAGSAGTAIAMTNFLVMIGAAVAAPLVGLLLEWGWDGVVVGHIPIYSSMDYRIAYSLFPVAAIVAIFIAYFIKETHCQVIDEY